MKKFILSFCFAAFLSAGLVSCSDEAGEVTPDYSSISNPSSDSNDPSSKPPQKP